MRYFFLLALLTFLPITAEDIVVPLSTQSTLQPVYLPSWQLVGETALTTSHLQGLLAVLQFDLNMNGSTHVAEGTPAREQLAIREGVRVFDSEKWRTLGVCYVVRAVVEGTRLHVRVDSVADGAGVATYATDLTGTLTTDRKQIHRLADALHEDLFGTRGIADTSILYTVRRKIAGTEEWRSEVWVSDYDGANARSVVAGGAYCVTPSFLPKTPDGFLYVSYRQGQPKIYSGSVRKGGSQRISDLRGNQLMPVVSGDGDQLAFICDAGGNPDLFLQSFDLKEGAIGKPRQLFAEKGAAQASPTFNPHGKEIAFVSNKEGTPRIYVLEIPADGVSAASKTPKLISKRNRENTSPAWSPDGRYIAYSAMTGDTRQIWIYDTQNRIEKQLTQGSGHKENPSWAADSCHLVFNQAVGSSSELYLITLNQPGAVAITSGPGEKRFPSWSSSP